MPVSRRHLLAVPPILALGRALPAWAADAITVAYAGSMGVVMDQGLGPAFTAKTGTAFHGIGQAAMALAHLLAAKTTTADVFVSVSAGPVKVVEAAGLESSAVPVASTEFVLAYSPKSKYAAAFEKAGTAGWVDVLSNPALRYGRTDPAVDPQGAYNLYCLQLAEIYYKEPGLAKKIAGPMENPAQIFAEPSLLARLQEGQIDATLGYKSAVLSQKLPYTALPPEINFSSPAYKEDYEKATLTLKGKAAHPSPLVFYAAALKNAANPAGATAFVDFLTSAGGQAIFAKYGYNPPKGKPV
jgi:molybdate/tungstate transport system substrate-binding protein